MHPQNGLNCTLEEQAATSNNLSTGMMDRYKIQCNANANANANVNVKEEATVTPSTRSGIITIASSTPGDDRLEYTYPSPLRRNPQFCADSEKSRAVSAKMQEESTMVPKLNTTRDNAAELLLHNNATLLLYQ